jgi:hypothetical protein
VTVTPPGIIPCARVIVRGDAISSRSWISDMYSADASLKDPEIEPVLAHPSPLTSDRLLASVEIVPTR